METIMINGRAYACTYDCDFQADGGRIFGDDEADQEIVGSVYIVRRDDGAEVSVEKFYGASHEAFIREILRKFQA